MKIHGIVYIIIGAIVLSVSLFREQLIFFRYVGGLFIVWGTFKVIFKLITGSSSKKEALNNFPQGQQGLQQQGQRQQQNQNNQRQQNDINRTQMYNCQRCSNNVFPHNHFCSNCGMRLK